MRYLICLLFVFCSWTNSYSQTCITSTYTSQVGVREKTGKNDGVEVEKYLKTVNLGPGYSWCAAFVKWCLMQCGVVTPINGWSATAINRNNYVYKNQTFLQDPKPGDVFTIWSYNSNRVIHTGFFNGKLNTRVIRTVEGNTNDNGSANGDGVYKRTRPLYSIHTLSRWD